MLASVAEQAGLSLTWLETPENMFSHDETHVILLGRLSELWSMHQFLSESQNSCHTIKFYHTFRLG